MDVEFLLIQRMKAGDDGAIERFVRNYYPNILRYCRAKVRDPGHAEDLTQETFEKFFRTLSSYRPYGRASNYLYAIAGNLCNDYFRARRELPVEQLPERPENPMDEAERRLDLQRAMDRLTPEVREVAILYFLEQRKLREIAKILGIGLPLVKYRVKRARECLLRELGEERDKS